jgi:predicted RNA methylase
MKRKIESEQYYTNKELAKLCINKIKQYYILDDFDLILEPSAGDGSFYDLLPKEKTVGIDIEPKHQNIQKLDFFTYIPPQNKKIITIGNPPFGARGSLAMKFFDGVCKFSDVVAFILPRSFKKYTFKDRINPYFHLIEEFDCDSFNTPDGEVLSVKCVFQIWERRNFKRDIIV